MSVPSDFAAWRDAALADGFDEVLERRWPPDTLLETHTHPFALRAVVVEGELWLTTAGESRHLEPGGGFELMRNEPHAERYGTQGAVYWVARRN